MDFYLFIYFLLFHPICVEIYINPIMMIPEFSVMYTCFLLLSIPS